MLDMLEALLINHNCTNILMKDILHERHKKDQTDRQTERHQIIALHFLLWMHGSTVIITI